MQSCNEWGYFIYILILARIDFRVNIFTQLQNKITLQSCLASVYHVIAHRRKLVEVDRNQSRLRQNEVVEIQL